MAGWGQGAKFGDVAWTPYQQSLLDDCVASGLRRFYWPEPMEGSDSSYDWSFMHPTASLPLASGASTINLPDDFGGFEGQVTVLSTSSTSMPWKIEWRNEALIREKYSVTPTMTGPPMFCAEVPLKGTTGTQGQRFQLLLFPLADQAYTLQVQYYVSPDFITSGTFPYAYGGATHTETILESCMAVFEERQDDMVPGTGPHGVAFRQRLAASVSMDRRNKPQKLGPNRDRSDLPDWQRGDTHFWQGAATYNGTTFN